MGAAATIKWFTESIDCTGKLHNFIERIKNQLLLAEESDDDIEEEEDK